MNRFEKWSVWITSAVTAVTGLGLFWLEYFVATDDLFAVINHPLEPWLLKAHILAAPALIFAIGLIASRHIWRHYRSGIRWGRRSGIATVLMAAPMVVTGYLIQILTHRGWIEAMGIAHLVFGVIYCVGLLLHQVFVRRGPGGKPSHGTTEGRRAAGLGSETGARAGSGLPGRPRPRQAGTAAPGVRRAREPTGAAND